MTDGLKNHDYAFRKLQNANFHHLTFKQVDFSNADLTGADLSNCLCIDCDFSEAILKNADLQGTNFQHCNLRGADISGANLFSAMLETADLTDVRYDEQTQYFAMHCPEEGSFIAYKECLNYRIVQLLVPADARRSSATNTTCRCDKAKVLSIKDKFTKASYNEAISYVDANFIYRTGEWVLAENYNPNRWVDSTGGIHFWMTWKEACGYM
ncbi:MAG: pentapeptide repeat-containing protein [Enterococcus viikkiensis]|uniref:Pentapeptide repeat-containing protein n=1 Tax=Enterococcus viikkiensis TaxID=930854 RepID=A0ABU3FMB0_9ENTE|nr:pentapeptide repeat-containing protein [Enterococcus viikkiensis]MDT2827041.1 pentapeptide repeat-containing protein [Enterococcus viikkiensis]